MMNHARLFFKSIVPDLRLARAHFDTASGARPSGRFGVTSHQDEIISPSTYQR